MFFSSSSLISRPVSRLPLRLWRVRADGKAGSAGRALALAALCVAGLAGLSGPAAAESIAASVVSSTASLGSASMRSLSDSVEGSSRSSTGDTRKAAGQYRLIELAERADRPGQVTLRLRRDAGPTAGVATAQAAAQATGLVAAGSAAPVAEAADELLLHVPAEALAARPLAVGDQVVARARSYGLWFAQRAADGADRPFFLALHDDWQGELGSRAL